MKSSAKIGIIVCMNIILMLSFSVVLAGNEIATATKNMTNETKNTTNVTENITGPRCSEWVWGKV